MPERGDRAAPPPAKQEWDLISADNQAAKGWEQLAAQAPGPLREAWLILRSDPREGAPRNRMHRLKADFKTRTVAGSSYEHWQYEVTGGGRIWYCIDDARHILHITYAGAGHPLGDALFEHGGDIWGEDGGVAGSCWKAPAIGGCMRHPSRTPTVLCAGMPKRWRVERLLLPMAPRRVSLWRRGESAISHGCRTTVHVLLTDKRLRRG